MSIHGVRRMMRAALWLLGLVAATSRIDQAFAQQNPHGQLPVTQMAQPFAILIRDPAVHQQLKLTDKQRQQIRSLTDQLDPDLWKARNQSPDKAQALLARVTSTAETRMKAILNAQQQQRLAQIGLRVRGVQALTEEATIKSLELQESQVTQIQAILTDVGQKIETLKESHREQPNAELFRQKFTELHTDLNTQLSAVLNETQHERWQKLLGEPLDISQLGKSDFRAPKLPKLTEWINTKPLTDETLRGKVVVLHFFAFGCINCIHNYPAYQHWQEAFRDQPDLIMIGVHTPETEAERSFAELKNKVQGAKFRFPVVMDSNSDLWNAWGNSMWPAVYLIDKQGRVRAWWLGELNWQGAEGERIMQERIEELLAEPN